jgi:hypothetical protein
MASRKATAQGAAEAGTELPLGHCIPSGREFDGNVEADLSWVDVPFQALDASEADLPETEAMRFISPNVRGPRWIRQQFGAIHQE